MIIILYSPMNIKKTQINKKVRSLAILNKFLKGVRITKIKPVRLLTKNLGYRKIFSQKLFMFYVL